MAHDPGRMAGFRNVLVHDYRELDIAVMKDVIENRLGLFAEFTTAMLKKVRNGISSDIHGSCIKNDHKSEPSVKSYLFKNKCVIIKKT